MHLALLNTGSHAALALLWKSLLHASNIIELLHTL